MKLCCPGVSQGAEMEYSLENSILGNQKDCKIFFFTMSYQFAKCCCHLALGLAALGADSLDDRSGIQV